MDKKPSRYDKYSAPKYVNHERKLTEFVPPEKIAEKEIKNGEKIEIKVKANDVEPEDNQNSSENSAIESKPKSKNKYLKFFTKKPVIIIIVLILIAGGLSGYYLISRKTVKAVPKTVQKVVAPTPKKPVSNLVPSNLTGLMVDPSLNNLPVTGVMIENSVFARPQSGLGSAGVVFEALAEGGISRFLALYQDTSPNSVGPIRSARPYYISWDLGFDAPYSHVGGSPEALSDIQNWSVKDLNQFYNGNYYQRISSRAAPHNVYTSIARLNQLEASDGFGKSIFTSWQRKADSPLKIPTAKTINLTLSSSDYNVTYTYNPSTNEYLRDEGGAPHIDANTNTQISPKVVIAIVVPWNLEADGYHLAYQTIGSGTAYIFQDGGVTIGQWSKSSNNSQILFTDSSNQPIKLNAGQTWITAIGDSNSVAYTPN